jgi:hypothetical protein
VEAQSDAARAVRCPDKTQRPVSHLDCLPFWLAPVIRSPRSRCSVSSVKPSLPFRSSRRSAAPESEFTGHLGTETRRRVDALADAGPARSAPFSLYGDARNYGQDFSFGCRYRPPAVWRSPAIQGLSFSRSRRNWKRLAFCAAFGIGWRGCRGRDTDFSVPPAQIPASGFPALGSCLK